MTILSVWLINKSGGLIWQRDFSQNPTNNGGFSHAKLSTNDYLVFASTFQSIHAITTQLDPLEMKSSGILSVDWRGYNLPALQSPNLQSEASHTPTASAPFKLSCFQTLTGLKIILLTSPKQPQLEFILKRIYESYADFVMKNPFHTLEMPIRSERFDIALQKLAEQMSSPTY